MLKRIPAAFVLLLCASSLALAQGPSCAPGTYGFFGNLIIPVRDYPQNIEVLLLSHMGEQLISYSYLDMSNRFSMGQLSEGRYDVVVRLDGFKELRESVDIPGFGSSACASTGIFWLTPEDTVVILDERLRGYPKEAIDEYVLAMNADVDKKFEDVVKHLDKVVKLAADWLDAHVELGAAYEEVHRPVDAEKEYRSALELKPDGFRALMSLGRLLVAEADDKIQDPALRDTAQPILNQAREVLSAAIAHDAKSAMASYLLGTTDFRLASYKDAEIELKRALELDSTMYPARIMLINVYFDQKQWQNALDQADMFIFENPSSPLRQQVTNTRASILRRLQTPL